ncbi:hypothetical protein GNP81_13230 [Aliivibrio fischeri]|uniref:hypothetical protein n=1 Tax=Aliivibrio fischeri TaxID=668 RepID=UPI0012D883BC|nr:hypothetical protein [Aliivibrio fischeri]MUK61501.1 hypothetical protein [Aliivibrio fischeri]MUL22228.1 hypothetical protein [Aliivibrio fischeri]MUL25557.1 hypothetical protein [Aliivibrio fischeri]
MKTEIIYAARPKSNVINIRPNSQSQRLKLEAIMVNIATSMNINVIYVHNAPVNRSWNYVYSLQEFGDYQTATNFILELTEMLLLNLNLEKK